MPGLIGCMSTSRWSVRRGRRDAVEGGDPHHAVPLFSPPEVRTGHAARKDGAGLARTLLDRSATAAHAQQTPWSRVLVERMRQGITGAARYHRRDAGQYYFSSLPLPLAGARSSPSMRSDPGGSACWARSRPTRHPVRRSAATTASGRRGHRPRIRHRRGRLGYCLSDRRRRIAERTTKACGCLRKLPASRRIPRPASRQALALERGIAAAMEGACRSSRRTGRPHQVAPGRLRRGSARTVLRSHARLRDRAGCRLVQQQPGLGEEGRRATVHPPAAGETLKCAGLDLASRSRGPDRTTRAAGVGIDINELDVGALRIGRRARLSSSRSRSSSNTWTAATAAALAHGDVVLRSSWPLALAGVVEGMARARVVSSKTRAHRLGHVRRRGSETAPHRSRHRVGGRAPGARRKGRRPAARHPSGRRCCNAARAPHEHMKNIQ